jgi:hypothetical protein
MWLGARGVSFSHGRFARTKKRLPFGGGDDRTISLERTGFRIGLMSKSFRADDLNQSLLFPSSLHDWLPEDHLARFLSDVVNALDLEAIYASYSEKDGRGMSAYSPESGDSMKHEMGRLDVDLRQQEATCRSKVGVKEQLSRWVPDPKLLKDKGASRPPSPPSPYKTTTQNLYVRSLWAGRPERAANQSSVFIVPESAWL